MARRKRPEQLTPVIRWNACAREYEKALTAFVREMLDSINYHIAALMKRTGIVTQDAAPHEAPKKEVRATLKRLFDTWERKGSAVAHLLTERQLKRLLDYVSGRYKPLLGRDAGKETARIRELVRARYKENYALIRSIPEEAKQRYEAVLYDAITSGDNAAIISRLRAIDGITERRARLIARDQTAKAAEAFTITPRPCLPVCLQGCGSFRGWRPWAAMRTPEASR